MSLPTFEKFDIHTDENSVGTRWTKYVTQLENLFVAMDISSKKRKKALLLHYAGTEVFEIHETLENTGDESAYDETKKALETYFKPRVNKEFEIYEFRQMKQLLTESVDQFATRLRQKAAHCGFSEGKSAEEIKSHTDAEIKSQIIQGCKSKELRQKVLREDMDLAALLKTARTMELSKQQADTMGKNDDLDQPEGATNAIRKPKTKYGKKFTKSPTPHKQKAVTNRICRQCGGNYPHATRCPAIGEICNYCKKPNHFVSQCRKRKRKEQKVKNVTENTHTDEDDDESSDECAFGIQAKVTKIHNKLPYYDITINGKKTKILIDTGSSINIIDEDTLGKINLKPKLDEPKTKAYAYGQSAKLPIKGTFKATTESKHRITVSEFHVVKGNHGSLLGYTTAVELQIIPKINTVKMSRTEEILEKYNDVFEGLGKLKERKIKLHVDESIAPVAEPHRRIPFHVRKQVENELERLESLDIIEKAEGPTPWVSPIVVAPKPKSPNEIRLCVDMRKANKAIERERHLTPTIDDLIMDLNGAKVFSKLDLKNGFHQLELEPDSRYMTTFSTHAGLWRYKRLNFGVSAAPEIFQNEIRQALEGLKCVRNLSDDIIVFGKSQSEHDANLEALLERLREKNLTLNKDKCSFNRNKISFFGYVFSDQGISADPNKVDAIKNADRPKNASEVKSFLGMTNFVSRFIPNYSTLTEPLRKLVRGDTKFKWTNNQERRVWKHSKCSYK